MRVAALYDVHANLPALDAVLAEVEVEDVDAIVLGGDCSHGPQPRETLDGTAFLDSLPLDGVEADAVVAGHTHMQQDRTVGGIRWINAGSVGLPYEDDIKAFWALLGPDVELRRTGFDVSAAIRAFESVGRDDTARFVENFRTAPSRQEAAEYFESLV